MSIHTHNQNPQALRGQIAMMLGTSVDNVVVRIYAGPGHYGRSNGGNAGAEDEAVILSKAVGRPVRVQWMRPDDLLWSTQSPPGISNIRIGWDASGTITAYEADHYMPAMQDDRLVGALLAGLPTPPPPDVRAEAGSIGSTVNGDLGSVGLRPGAERRRVRTRNVSARTEGVAAGHRSPRSQHADAGAAAAELSRASWRSAKRPHWPASTRSSSASDRPSDQRLIGALKAVREASGWQTRPSPSPNAASTGATPVTGQGVSVMLRSGTYWACVCQVSVVPGTGKVTVDKYTIAVDPGIVVNPLQLKRHDRRRRADGAQSRAL